MEYKEFEFLRGKLRLRQPVKGHRLSIVEVLFVYFARGIKRKSKVLDLGAGFGALSLLLTLRYGCRVWALERDKDMLELLHYNVQVNGLLDKITPVEGDLRYIDKLFQKQTFDVVIANPPFFKDGFPKKYHFETDTKLEDFVRAASYVMKDGGYFNVILPAHRLTELVTISIYNKLSPCNMKILYSKENKPAKYIIVTCIKNSRCLTSIEYPFFMDTQNTKSVLQSFCDIIT
ncbi:tRNA1(Val) (adenine(37)-N6)-methyltransferase [Thermocrinis minervae]|uniref:tRNA1(Val) A37 N6-methylase TrmN6 n=1 Tax=Thermocrinis minervae TaxID=381751 RepID=A0A1M6QT73_9AQUI|nr:methyltransferase [Thermocrinis minervae]SHK23313.1 tRNA1(Val) A37 N6-methylase TrmN6 [Thermocrinis minervae]